MSADFFSPQPPHHTQAMAPSTAGGGQSRWAALGAIAVLVITCGAYMGGSGAGVTAKFEAARFDDETGAPLNDAAMNLLVAAEADGSRSSIAPEASIRALDSVPSVYIEPGTWKFVTIDVFVPADPTHSKSVRTASKLRPLAITPL